MKTLAALLSLFFLTQVYSPALAGEIRGVRGKKISVELNDDEHVFINQRLVVTSSESGEPTAVIEITKKKGKLVFGKVLKGSVRIGDSTSLAEGDKPQSTPEITSHSEKVHASNNEEPRDLASQNDEANNPFYSYDEAPNKGRKSSLGRWGFGLGITPTTIQVSDGSKENSLKGTNFVVRVLYDKPIKKAVNLLLGASLLPLAGSQSDDTLGTAKVDASYYAFEANGRLGFTSDPRQGGWLGGGINILLAANSTSSNVIDPNSMGGTRWLFQLNAGYNTKMSSDYLMFRGDMLIYPQSTMGDTYVRITQYVFSAIYFF